MRKTDPMGRGVLPERVEGPRLVLRRWTPADLERLAELVQRNLAHLRPWMPWVATEPLPGTRRLELLHLWEHQWRDGGDVLMAIVLDETLVGGTGLHHRPEPDGLEIGYWVDKDHLRRGIATETAAMLTSAALSLPDISAVQIHHDKANTRSAMVPRRLGYRFLGESPDRAEAPGEVGIDCAWEMPAHAWLTSPAPSLGRSNDPGRPGPAPVAQGRLPPPPRSRTGGHRPH